MQGIIRRNFLNMIPTPFEVHNLFSIDTSVGFRRTPSRNGLKLAAAPAVPLVPVRSKDIALLGLF